MNIEPQRAAVKPRIRTRDGGSVPLENELLPLLHPGAHGIIVILGDTGSGRTSALQHLACLAPTDAHVNFVDNPITPEELSESELTIYTARRRLNVKHAETYYLAPWTTDDLIEYLLAKYKDQCASVMQRIHAAEGAKLLNGNPELWRVVLDEFAADPELKRFGDAFLSFLRKRLDESQMALVRRGCLAKTLMASDTVQRTSHFAKQTVEPVGVDTEDWTRLEVGNFGEAVWRLLRHESVQTLLAREQILADLRADEKCKYLVFRMPRTMIRILAAAVCNDQKLLEKLRKLALEPNLQAMAGSILNATGMRWAPDKRSGWNMFAKTIDLSGGYMECACWPGIDLNGSNCTGADFSNSDLSSANLSGMKADDANFRRAQLRHAKLKDMLAAFANFSHADMRDATAIGAQFRGADFERANFEGADLSKANIVSARLVDASFQRAKLKGANVAGCEMTGADFSGANLSKASLRFCRLRFAKFTGAIFVHADLHKADMEFMKLPSADFRLAKLSQALLTGSFIPKGNFAGANLTHSGLAEIDWERADLRNADLTGCTFFMAASRSGLVDSDLASEGSRTGFYTDDFSDQNYKAPELIRKANLRGADLRGAKLDKTDFYLVDLRDAKYDPDQAEHLRRCGAILHSRV